VQGEKEHLVTIDEFLNVIIGGVMHKAHNLLHTSHPLNDSMLATCSDNPYTLSAVLQIHR